MRDVHRMVSTVNPMPLMKVRDIRIGMSPIVSLSKLYIIAVRILEISNNIYMIGIVVFCFMMVLLFFLFHYSVRLTFNKWRNTVPRKLIV